MLNPCAEADAQIIVAGDECQRRCRPQAGEPDQVHPRLVREGAAQDQRPKATSWKVVFHLASVLTGIDTLQRREEFAQPGDDDLAQQDDQRRDDRPSPR